MIKIHYTTLINEAVINKEEAMTLAFEKLSKYMNSEEIEKFVIKKLKKARTFHDIEKAIEKRINNKKKKNTDFKEAVLKNLSHSSLNEMALKHLKDTDKYWESGDIEKIADKYIENARKDGKSDVTIIRGLTKTFDENNKKFSKNPELYKKEYMSKVKQAVKNKIGHVDFKLRSNMRKKPEYVKLKNFVDKELENENNSEEVKKFLKEFKKHIERTTLTVATKQILYVFFYKEKFSDDVIAIARKIYDSFPIINRFKVSNIHY